ncbi:MAG TPA: exodeoxyribonuclease VII large subunit [Sedimenticola sp.]|nr:exodeoxyribonuclease VII large subunit [Sedimenticola sp.]
MPASSLPPDRDIYSVSRLNSEARAVLEGSFPLLWVEGEISNLARPSSGHIYFSLKDARAQVRCAMFRMRRMHLRFQPGNGMQVLVRARVSLYEARGEFQLAVEHMEPAGEGALRQAFEELKQRLGAEGLFDAAHKKPLPPFPKRIGVITSPTGAAIRDLLTVLRRRFPGISVVVYPVPVQGEGAAARIADMIRLADRRGECDLLVLTRGGGSLEDLMAFNDEGVARAIHAASLPIVSAVGHEIDFTIADFVADQRAPTPSAAAELISPDRRELLQRLARLRHRLCIGQERRQAHFRTRLQHIHKRLERLHPGVRLRQRQQRLDELEQRLLQGMRNGCHRRRGRLEVLDARLRALTPAHRLERLKLRRGALSRRLRFQMTNRLEQARRRLANAGQHLQAVSPLATLGRGYAIVSRYPSGEILRDAAQVEPGERVEARLAQGSLLCRVEKKEHNHEVDP